jgi:hypothetical protein
MWYAELWELEEVDYRLLNAPPKARNLDGR